MHLIPHLAIKKMKTIKIALVLLAVGVFARGQVTYQDTADMRISYFGIPSQIPDPDFVKSQTAVTNAYLYYLTEELSYSNDSLAVHLDTIQALRVDINSNIDSIAVHLDTLQALRVDINSNIDSLAVHLDTVQALRTDINSNTADIATNASDISTNETNIDLKANKANAALTGSTTADNIQTDVLTVGSGGNTVGLDSITKDGSSVLFYDGSDTLAPYIPASGKANLDDYTLLLTDIDLWYSFGAGAELAGDTVLFATTQDKVFGHRKVYEDSIEIMRVETWISSGDTMDFSIVYGDTIWDADGTVVAITPEDSLDVTTSFTTSTIPEGNYVWIDVTAVVGTRKPICFRCDVYAYIKRD